MSIYTKPKTQFLHKFLERPESSLHLTQQSFPTKMAIFSPATDTARPYLQQQQHHSLQFSVRSASCSLTSLSFPLLLHRRLSTSCTNPNTRVFRCRAALSPQPPPQSEPPPEKDPARPKGVLDALSRFQDQAQIFFAVLFWMTLFFWASAWDRRNDGSGRRNKGSRRK